MSLWHHTSRLVPFVGWLDTRRGARIALAAWIAVSLIEYVILGPRSFIWMDDEGELLVTHFNFLARIHPGGQYSHLMQSGADAISAFFFGSAYVSLDGFLLGTLPVWIGIAIHKALTFALGLCGTYLLCRKGLGCSRSVAVAFGALYTVMYYRMQIVTFGTGLNFALLPLGVYFCIIRLNRPRYFLGVVTYAFAAASMLNFHGILPLVAALASTAVLLNRIRIRVLLAAAIIPLPFLANSAESFAAMLAVSPHSIRGSLNASVAFPFFATFSANFISAFREIPAMPVLFWPFPLAAATFLLRQEWGLLARTGAAFAIPPFLMALYAAFSWQSVGLAPFRNVPYSLFLMGLLPLATLAGAKATDLAAEFFLRIGVKRWQKIPALAVLLIAGAILLHYKYKNFNAWLTTAGQSMYATIDNVRFQPWASPEPFRVISLRHKQMQPEPNIFFSFYGVPMFDAWTNLVSIEHAAYWRHGIHRDDERWSADVGLDWRFFGGESRFHYRLGEQISLPLLALANVRYVFSPVPLSDSRLRYVDGPAHPPLDKGLTKATGAAALGEGRLRQQTLERWYWQLNRVFHYGKVYVYEIGGAMPRVFAARGVTVAPDEADWPSFLAQVEKFGPDGVVVARRKDSRTIPSQPGRAHVRSFDLVVDGFDISVDAPEGGVIVVNVVHQPFFTATVDGTAVPLVSVNGIQTAVPVPPGARALKIRYHRPTANERIRGLL